MISRFPGSLLLGAAVALCLFGASALAGGLPPAPVPFGAIAALSPLPGQNTSFALGINEDGRPVGGSSFTDPKTEESGPQTPVFWTNRGPAALALPRGAVQGVGTAADNLNRVAGMVDLGDGLGRATLWVRGKPVVLPQPAGSDALIRRLTPQGVVGASLTLADERERAALWSGNRLSLLPPLPGDTDSVLGGVNFRLQAVGSSGNDDGSLAVLWQGNRTTPLPLPPGATNSAAVDVNDNGVILGVVGDAESETVTPVLWSGRRIQALPTLPGGLVVPLDLNTRNDAVGVSILLDTPGVKSAASVQRALVAGGPAGVGSLGLGGDFFGGIVWLRGRAFPLDAFLPPNSGWTQLVPVAINNRRQVVGAGLLNDEPRGFVLNLPPNP